MGEGTSPEMDEVEFCQELEPRVASGTKTESDSGDKTKEQLSSVVSETTTEMPVSSSSAYPLF